MKTPAERLTAVRHHMRTQNLDALIVPRADEHLGEYVSASAERLAWLTGFTGSAGLAIVLPERAALFVDGRYVLQAQTQADSALYDHQHLIEQPPARWLADTVSPGARIGYDPLLISQDGLAAFTGAGLTMVPAAPNPIDAAWTDRPAPPIAPAIPYPTRFAGKSAAEKRAQIAETLRKQRLDAAVVTDPASIAWLLNIRGDDVPYTPIALSFLIARADDTATLFIDSAKLPDETRAWLGNGVAIQDRSTMPASLAELRGKRVSVDPSASPVWFARHLADNGAQVVSAPDPCLLPKARKNSTEQDGTRAAHRRDAVALCRFLRWLETAAGQTTEMGAADQLAAFRRELPEFRGESFPAIAGAGEHGAIMHYRVTPATDRAIKPNELFLIDSGAQFNDGTTDVTRTVWTGPDAPPEDVRGHVTRVLKGHIAIATCVFPEGVAGPHLDAFARRALWDVGLDFDHGTGHGVGHYLSVHEGPASISRAGKRIPIAEGMILSDEPGFYLPGQYRIRLENLLLVQPAHFPAARKPFLRFETLTLAPFDRRLIDPALLSQAETEWLDAYHTRVLAEIGPALDDATRTWLATACRPLG